MPNYTSVIESSGNTSLLVSDIDLTSEASPNRVRAYAVAAQYNGRTVDLYFPSSQRQSDGSTIEILVPLPSAVYANNRSPVSAEVLPGENVITVVIDTLDPLNGSTQTPLSANYLQIVRFSLSTGVETDRYNFRTDQFVPRPSFVGYYGGGDYLQQYWNDPDKVQSVAGVRPSNEEYDQVLKKFPSLFGFKGVSTNQTATTVTTKQTSSQVDNLTGVSKVKDVFNFTAQPGFSDQADTITSFSTKEKDTIQISKSVFGIATGRFAVAKKPKSLKRLLATDVDIVYNQKAGQLILNANRAEPGFGADGGVFAVLAGNPTLATSSVSFV